MKQRERIISGDVIIFWPYGCRGHHMMSTYLVFTCCSDVILFCVKWQPVFWYLRFSIWPDYISMTSPWACWRLKSPASRLLTQSFIQGPDQRKHPSSASLACAGKSPVTGEFPTQTASNAEMFPFDDVIMRKNICLNTGACIITATCVW